MDPCVQSQGGHHCTTMGNQDPVSYCLRGKSSSRTSFSECVSFAPSGRRILIWYLNVWQMKQSKESNPWDHGWSRRTPWTFGSDPDPAADWPGQVLAAVVSSSQPFLPSSQKAGGIASTPQHTQVRRAPCREPQASRMALCAWSQHTPQARGVATLGRYPGLGGCWRGARLSLSPQISSAYTVTGSPGHWRGSREQDGALPLGTGKKREKTDRGTNGGDFRPRKGYKGDKQDVEVDISQRGCFSLVMEGTLRK